MLIIHIILSFVNKIYKSLTNVNSLFLKKTFPKQPEKRVYIVNDFLTYLYINSLSFQLKNERESVSILHKISAYKSCKSAAVKSFSMLSLAISLSITG